MSGRLKVAFAVPGDIEARTGGTIYDRRVIEELSAHGWRSRAISLPDTFPLVSADAMHRAFAILGAVPGDEALIVDGLAFGALDTVQLEQLDRPVIAMVHHPVGLEAGLNKEDAVMLLARERENLSLASHVVVPSPHTMAILHERFGVPPEKITVARPGMEGRPKTASVPEAPPLILSVGILSPRKGHDVLLHALHEVSDLEWRAVIVGREHDGRTAGDLRSLRNALGLSGRATFSGEVRDEELAALYGRASIFALATRYEGYGIVFGEAMRAGLPIVSCDTGAVADTVPAEAAVLVPPDDARALAGALRRLLSDEPHRASLARASARHGAGLKGWDETARIMAGVLAGHR